MTVTTSPKALFFDVFGTCVDWRKTVTNALKDAAQKSLNDSAKSLDSNVRQKAFEMTIETWGRFAQDWRNTYKVFTRKIATDPSIKWKSVDEHHLGALLDLLRQYEIEGLWSPEEARTISLLWHYLDPWEDSVEGVKQLNRKFYTCTLSNGNLSLLEDLKTHSEIPFTHLLSSEMFASYKPSPKVYLGAAEKMGLQPKECAMVASHLPDLKAAKAAGFGTAVYTWRPQEEDWSAEQVTQAREEGWVDVWVDGDEKGFITAAERLGVAIDSDK